MITIAEKKAVGEFYNLYLKTIDDKSDPPITIEYLIPCGDLIEDIFIETRGNDIFEDNYLVDIVEEHKSKYWDDILMSNFKLHLEKMDSLDI